MKNKSSIKHQIFLIYIATTVLIAVIVCFYIFYKTRNYTQDSLISNYQNTASFITKDIENELDAYRSHSFILSHNPSLNQLLLNSYDLYDTVVSLNNEIEPSIQYLLDSNDVINDIIIYTNKTEEQIPSTYFQNVSRIVGSNWYNSMQNLDGAITFTEGDFICVAAPIRNYYSPRTDLGLVRLNINLQKITSQLLENHPDIHFILKNTDGTEIFNSMPEKSKLKNYNFLSSNILLSTDITVDYYVHNSLLHIPIFQILTPVLLILLAFVLLAQIFMQYLNRHIFHRLESIINNVENIDIDNLEFNIVDNGNDEIGILVNQINEMSDRINNLFQELIVSKENEKRAELETLRARIDPHFLYNIMDTINWIAMDKDTDLICMITYELGNYYRTCLNYGQALYTIENEIENIKAYLKLQQIATSQGFDVLYDIDTELLHYKTCDFILQPLVENAVKHGIKPLRDERRGIITISLHEDEDLIVLSVSDNGVGLSNPSLSASSNFKSTHYGIQNINERIQLVFGQDYGVELADRTDCEGTVARVILPKIFVDSQSV